MDDAKFLLNGIDTACCTYILYLNLRSPFLLQYRDRSEHPEERLEMFQQDIRLSDCNNSDYKPYDKSFICLDWFQAQKWQCYDIYNHALVYVNVFIQKHNGSQKSHCLSEPVEFLFLCQNLS